MFAVATWCPNETAHLHPLYLTGPRQERRALSKDAARAVPRRLYTCNVHDKHDAHDMHVYSESAVIQNERGAEAEASGYHSGDWQGEKVA